MQAAMLPLEFLRLRRVGEGEAHAIGEDGEPGLRFAHVPYRMFIASLRVRRLLSGIMTTKVLPFDLTLPTDQVPGSMAA